MRRGDGRVDEVLDAGLPRELREPLALLLLAFDADFPRVLHRVRTPSADERPPYRWFIVEITRDNLDAELLHRPRRVRLRVPRHAPHAHALRDQLTPARALRSPGTPCDEYAVLTRLHGFLLASGFPWSGSKSDFELGQRADGPIGRRGDIYLDNTYLDVKMLEMDSSGIHVWLVLMKAYRTLAR